MTMSDAPFRDDEGAREMYVQHLEGENKSLAAENERLKLDNQNVKAENRRLFLIGSELSRSTPPASRSAFVDSHLRRQIDDNEVALARCQAELTIVRRTAWFFVAAALIVPQLVKLIADLAA